MAAIGVHLEFAVASIRSSNGKSYKKFHFCEHSVSTGERGYEAIERIVNWFKNHTEVQSGTSIEINFYRTKLRPTRRFFASAMNDIDRFVNENSDDLFYSCTALCVSANQGSNGSWIINERSM